MLFGHSELKIIDVCKPWILVQSKHQPIVQTEPKGQDSFPAVLHKDDVHIELAETTYYVFSACVFVSAQIFLVFKIWQR